jgi:TolA-binding protein
VACFGSQFATTAAAQPPAAKESSDAAIRQYRDAVAFQNRQVYDLAIDEWNAFLKRFPDDPLAPAAQHYLGVCQFQLGKYAEAEAAFAAVLEKHANYQGINETYLNLGLTQFNQGQSGDKKKLAAAAATFAKLLEKFPTGKEAPLALYYRAEALYGTGKKQESLAPYKALIEKHADNALRSKALYGLGVAQQETGDPAGAIATYTSFLTDFADNPLATEVGMRAGDALLAQKKYAEAEKRFAAAAEAKDFPLADYALLRQGACLFNMQKYKEAASAYSQLIEKYPKSTYLPPATLAAGQSAFLAGDYDNTRKWLGSDVLKGEAAVEAAHWIAKSYLKQKQPAEALKVAEAALPTAADSSWLPDLLLDQADAMYDVAGSRKDSIAKYAALAAAHPGHAAAPQAAYMAGYAALGEGQHADALAHAQKFLAAFPDHKLTPDVKIVEAESNLLLKKYAEAAGLYRKLLAEHGGRGEAPSWILRIAVAQQLAGQFDALVKDLEPKLGELKGAELTAEAQFLLGSSYFELKQNDKAIAALEASLAAAPKWRQADETLLTLARAQKQAGKIKEASASINRLLTEFPDSPLKTRAEFRLGEIQYADGKFAEAAAAYRKVVEQAGDGELAPYARFGLGWSYLSQQQYKPAAEAMTGLIEKHQASDLLPRAHYARAVARQQSGEFSGAMEDVEAFLKSDVTAGEKSDALYIRGLSQSGLKKFDDAATTFASILETDPQYAAADKVLYELAWSHLEGKQPKESAAAFARLAQEHKQSPLAAESFYRVGEFDYQNEKYDAAAKSYTEAVALAGKSDLGEKAAHKLAWSQFQRDQFDQAQESFAKQLTAYPQGPLAADAQVMLGESLFKQDNYEEALAAFRKAKGLNPSSDDFRVIALLHGGQSAAKLEKWDESLTLLTECATKFPESAYKNEVDYEQAWVLQNQAKTDEALKRYEQVADSGETVLGARARFMAGEIYFGKKDYKEAIRVFFKVAYGYGYPKSPEAYHTWQANAAFEAARCFEQRKQSDQAKKLYQEIVERFPKSEKATLAEKKLAALK